MILSRVTARLLLALCLTLGASISMAENKNFQLDEFDWRDERYQTKQWNQIDELVRHHFGTQLKGDINDLATLQRLVNKGLIPKNDTEKLQALGVVFGTVMHSELKLNWRIYHDALGRSRALCTEEKPECLFPITMLSRRIEAGLIPNVQKIYDSASTMIAPHLDKLPYETQ